MKTQGKNLLKKVLNTTFLLILVICHTQTGFGQTLNLLPSPVSNEAKLPEKSAIEKTKKELREQLKNTADPEVLAELNKNITTLDRQLIILDEPARHQYNLDNELSLPDAEQEISISRYDEWLEKRSSVLTDNQQITVQLNQQQLASSNAEKSLESIQKKIRETRNISNPTTETEKSLRLLQAHESSAQSWLSLSKLQEKQLREKQEQIHHTLELLDNTIIQLKKKVKFDKIQLDEQVALQSAEREKLLGQLGDTRNNLNEAEKRWLQSHQKYVQSTTNKEAINEEYETRFLATREAELLEDILNHAIERTTYLKNAWEVRFLCWNKTPAHLVKPGISNLEEYINIIDHQLDLLGKQYDSLASLYLQTNSRLENTETNKNTKKWLKNRLDILNRMLNTITTERIRLEETLNFFAQVKSEFNNDLSNRNIDDWLGELSALSISVWNAEVFVFDDQAITLGKMVVGIFLLFTGIWIARLFTQFIGRWMLSRLGLNEGISAAIQTVVFYILLITVVLFALKLINVPLTVFTVIGGALALGIGIGSQNLMSNFMSGLILLAERPIRVGDFVQINDLSGIVSHIGARSTNITTPENIDIIVPNSSFLDNHVTNWTLNDNKIRTSILVGVIYGSNVRKVTKLLKKAAETHGKVLKQPSPIVLFRNFGDDALVFELLIWVKMRRLIERLMIESDLRYQIEHLFREANIIIAFPQRDIHLDTTSPLELRMLQEKSNVDENTRQTPKAENVEGTDFHSEEPNA